MQGPTTILRDIFADRRRPLVGLLATIWIVGLGARYAHYSMNAQPGYARCLVAPDACDDSPIYMALWTVVEVSAGGYTIQKVGRSVPVDGNSSGLAVGDTVSVEGRFDSESQWVKETRREVHELRPAKRALGVIGVLWLGIVGLRTFTWRRGRLGRRG